MRKSYEGALATLPSSRLLKYHNYNSLEAGGEENNYRLKGRNSCLTIIRWNIINRQPGVFPPQPQIRNLLPLLNTWPNNF
jgi:hypothetical protein